MENNESTSQKPIAGLQNALTNMIDARLNMAKSILDSVQSSLENTTSNVKGVINDQKDSPVISALSSAIDKRAKSVQNFSDTLNKKNKKGDATI